ncbi:MAG TPA: TonB-dependent receptor [Bryobacteraceae bacterium]|jgi:outer membrane receptor protein involved in Fe transport|nr:TonB-dependent receptor [Bryobacteraceae bacterium]
MRFQVTVTLFLLFGASCFAQSAAGAAGISGTVRDASGAVVPGAKVTISNPDRGVERTLETNPAGLFAAPALVPGPGYSVKVVASGFAEYDANDLVLQVGENLALTINLQVGQTTTSVNVETAAQLLDDTKSDVSQVVGTREIMDLPINGRRVDAFVLNTPGVTNDGTFGLLTFRGVAGNNSFLLDGNDNTEQFYDENAGRTRIQSQISADAVQEFQVVSTNFSAEFGRAMGGVVNTVTKSGTNELHGTAFYFLRSTGFDAHDPFSNFNPTEHRVQTGGTVGGAIIKNKLFYFLSTDITRRNFPFVDSQVKVGFLDVATKTWVGCGAPATPAQCNAINGLLPRFYGQIPRTASNDLYFGRMDYNLNEKNTFSASFNFLRWKSPNGIQTGLSSTTGAGITGNGDDSVTVRNGKATWTFVPNGRWVNTFRYGLDTDRQADSFDQAELGGGLGYLDVSVAGVQLGPATYLPRVEPLEIRNEFADDVSWSKGRHMIKFGFTFEHVRDDVNYLSNRYGSYTYPTVTSFALDYTGNTTGARNYSAFSQAFGNPAVTFGIQDIGMYAMDTWKVTDKLTLTLGLRYEYTAAPPPPPANPLYPLTGQPLHTGPLDLSPRVGFAYRLNNKTVIRGGAGTFYARLVGGLLDDVLTGNGLYQVSDNLSNPALIAQGPVFPNVLAAPLTGLTQGASTLDVLSPKLKTPYSEQATIAVERQLAKDMVFTISGVFSRGVNLWGTQDINAPALGAPFTYIIDNASGQQVGTYTTRVYTGARPNPNFGAIYEETNGVSSWYDGLVLEFEKRFSHGFQSQAAYTWSHEIDDGQGAATNAIFGFSDQLWTYNGLYGFDKGSGALDQRQRFVYSFVWAPVFSRSSGAFAKYVVNNWQLSSITTIMSGRPTGSLTIHMNDTPVAGMLYNASSLNGFNGSSRVPFYPVNSLYTPWVQREDFRLTKNIPLPREGMRLSLNFEAFNIANNWSPTSLATQAYTEAKGVLTYTPAAFGFGTADGGFPDGTQARRLQVSARFMF